MSYPPPQNLYYQSVPPDKDTEHLRILSICWYIAAGLAALAGFFPSIYIIIGALAIAGKMGGGRDPMPPAVGWVFVAIGAVFMTIIWVGSVLAFVTGRSLP